MSSINPNNIDSQYPIAGQDNSSQGFRDNFTNIKNNFILTRDEIADLQSKAILKGAAIGSTAVDNNMSYTILKAVQQLNFTELTNDLTSISGAVVVKWVDSQYQYFTLSGSVTTFNLDSWPTSGQHAKIRIAITVPDTTYTVKLPDNATLGVADIKLADKSTRILTFPTVGTYLFEFSSYDNGATVLVRQLSNIPTTRTSNESATAVTARTLNLEWNGDELVYLSMSAALTLTFSTVIVPSRQVTAIVKNTTSGPLDITVPNANNNLNSTTVTVGANKHVTLNFTAFGTTIADVVASIIS